MTKPKPKPKPTEEQGLVGFFGHTFTTDERGNRRIQYQFRVVRAVPPDRWAVQHYSFSDGSPMHLVFYSESYLMSDEVTLYPDAESWKEGYERSERAHRDDRDDE